MPQRKDELTINKAEEDFYGLEILIFRQGRIANPPERERRDQNNETRTARVHASTGQGDVQQPLLAGVVSCRTVQVIFGMDDDFLTHGVLVQVIQLLVEEVDGKELFGGL